MGGKQMKHTDEPWEVGSSNDTFIFADCTYVAQTCADFEIVTDKHREDARRIVACVNACAGIETEDLEKVAKTRGSIPLLEAGNARIAELKDSLAGIIDYAQWELDGDIEKWGGYREDRHRRMRDDIQRARDVLGGKLGG
jgi:hypothetical protein